MQNHWEGTLNAKSSLVITGDEIPAGESAVVISVSPAAALVNPMRPGVVLGKSTKGKGETR